MLRHRMSWGWMVSVALLTTPAVVVAQVNQFCIACVWANPPCTSCSAGAASGFKTCSPTCSGVCYVGAQCQAFSSLTGLGVYASRTAASLRELDALNARQTVWLTSDPAPSVRLASLDTPASVLQGVPSAAAIERDCKGRIVHRVYTADERERIARETEILTL